MVRYILIHVCTYTNIHISALIATYLHRCLCLYVHTVCVFPIRCAIVIMPHNQTKTLNQTHSTLCVYMSVCVRVCVCLCVCTVIPKQWPASASATDATPTATGCLPCAKWGIKLTTTDSGFSRVHSIWYCAAPSPSSPSPHLVSRWCISTNSNALYDFLRDSSSVCESQRISKRTSKSMLGCAHQLQKCCILSGWEHNLFATKCYSYITSMFIIRLHCNFHGDTHSTQQNDEQTVFLLCTQNRAC